MADKKISRADKVAVLHEQVAGLIQVNHDKTENDSLTRQEGAAISDKIRNYRLEIAATIKEGAEPCQTCLASPDESVRALAESNVHGMIRRPSFVHKDYGLMPILYEVGCIVHPERSVGKTPEEAVDKWNAHDYTA